MSVSSDRERSRSRDAVVKAQHSFDRSSVHIPMWDSSDPERAPPPLPLNPQSSPVRSSATSATIAAAHQAMVDRARDATPSPYTTNPMPERSPERSLIKGAAHRRMQSLQTTTVRDIRNLLDHGQKPDRSPERSPERASCVSVTTTPTPSSGLNRDYFTSFDRPLSRDATPTPTSRDHLRETPSRRPSSRPSHKAILGENTPPSTTMLALQTMNVRDIPDSPLSNVTNGATRPTQTSQDFGAISTQILSLTTIATNLQHEMKHLSQRSKDNASDLNKLKDATNSRDEDIRHSLKELITTIAHINAVPAPSLAPSLGFTQARQPSVFSNATSTPPPPANKTFTIPRIASPASLFDERVGSPNPYSVEGAASVAMLEKIIREMVTKDGQERLLGTLNQLFDKASKENSSTAKKVADLVEFIKESPPSGALVCTNGHPVGTRSASHGETSMSTTSGPLTLASREVRSASGPTKSADREFSTENDSSFVNDEVNSLLKKIKDSVFHSGGLISEVKAQQRDLRGEVLHMGRNLAQKIDEARKPASNAKAIEDGSGKQDIARIIREGLDDLRTYLDSAMREKRRQSSSSNISRSTVDSREVYDVVKHALVERGLDRAPAGQLAVAPLDKDAILEAVKEAYEAYKPEVEIQQFGLERDEILQCLREGLEQHRSTSSDASAMNRAEILETIHEAMQNFTPPQPINESQEIKEELLAAFRDCLDEMKPALAVQAPGSRDRDMDVTREVVFDTVQAALAKYGPGVPQEIEISEEVLYIALIKALESSKNPLGAFGDDIRGLIGNVDQELRHLFQEYSAAHGRDTEQVLDHMKDGLEDLRRQIESYVDRSQDVTGKDEIIEEVRGGVGFLRSEMEKAIATGLEGDNAPIIVLIREQFDRLNASIAEIAAATSSTNHEALLLAVREGSGDSKSTRGLEDDTLEVIKDEFEQMQDVFITRSGGHKDEILDTLSAGFNIIEAKLASNSTSNIAEELEQLRSAIENGELSGASTAQREMLESMESTIDALKQSPAHMSAEMLQAIHIDLAKLQTQVRETAKADTEEVLDAVRIGLDDLRSHLEKKIDNPDRHMTAHNEILDTINDGIESLKTELNSSAKNPMDLTVSYEILETLKEGLRGLKSDFETLKTGRPRSDTRETTRDRALTTMGNEIVLADEGNDEDKLRAVQLKPEDSLRKDDLTKMEVMLSQLQVKVEAMDANINDIPQSTVETSGPAIKADLGSIENLLKDMQASLDLMAATQPGPEGAARKEDTDAIETLLRNTKAKLEELDPSSGQMGEKLDTLADKLNILLTDFGVEMKESTATKDNVLTVEALVLDLRSAVDDIKKSHEDQFKERNDASKTDIDALMLVALEVKEKVLELQIQGTDKLPSKHDLDELKGLIHDFRESHDKLKDAYDCDVGITAKAFDERKTEATDILLTVRDLKEYLEDIKSEVSAKLSSNGIDLAVLSENVNGMEQTISQNFSIAPVVGELVDTVTREFERITGSFEQLKVDQDEQAKTIQSKHDEVRDAMIADLCSKIDERCDAILMRFEEAKQDALEQTAEQDKIVNSSKEVAEELRVSIDTLGTTVTGMEATFHDLSSQFAANSNATIDRLEEGFSKVNDIETRSGAKEEHNLTRERLVQVSMAVEALQSDVTEYHPKFMVTLDEILAIINQHYSESQKAKEEQNERDRAASEHTRAITEEIKSNFSSLPALLPPPATSVIDTVEKYDDAPVHSKLDKLLAGIEATKEQTVQISRLDQIHQQVMATASEVSQFVSTQSRLITEGHESKEKELEEIGLLLQRRQAEKEHLESNVRTLQDEKESLLSALEQLRSERDNLLSQKSKLGSDVSALQTALEFRKEELHHMDVKADDLERRVRDMMLDHAGSLLRNRQAAAQATPNSAMKQRFASGASHSTLGALPTARGNPLTTGISMALKTRSPQRRNAGPPVAGAAGKIMPSRRILSLNQISHNTPTGAHGFLAANTPSQQSGGTMKRSHSVRSTKAARKTSWNAGPTEKGRRQSAKAAIMSTEEDDKENTPRNVVAVLGDIDDHDESDDEHLGDQGSVISTHDFADDQTDDDAESVGTVTGTEITSSAYGYADSDIYTTDGERSRPQSSGTNDGGSSYIGESDMSRRTSGVSEGSHSMVSYDEDNESVIQHEMDSEAGAHEDDEEQYEEAMEEGEQHTPVPENKKVVLFRGPMDTDSGLGTDQDGHTVGRLSGSDTDFYRREAEEAASSLAGA